MHIKPNYFGRKSFFAHRRTDHVLALIYADPYILYSRDPPYPLAVSMWHAIFHSTSQWFSESRSNSAWRTMACKTRWVVSGHGNTVRLSSSNMKRDCILSWLLLALLKAVKQERISSLSFTNLAISPFQSHSHLFFLFHYFFCMNILIH